MRTSCLLTTSVNEKPNFFKVNDFVNSFIFTKKIKQQKVGTIVRRGYMTIGGKTLKRVLQMRHAGLKKNVLKIAWKRHKSSIYEHRSYCFSIHSETTTNALLLSVSHECSLLQQLIGCGKCYDFHSSVLPNFVQYHQQSLVRQFFS